MNKKGQISLVLLSVITLMTSQLAVVGAQEPTSPNVWTAKQYKPKPKPQPKPPQGRPPRKTPRPRPVAMKPLLTLEFKILKREADGTAHEVNPYSTFYTGDQIQIRIKPNQNGYLYILANNEGQPQEWIFPDTRINNGQNFVKMNKEYIVPSNCDPTKYDKACWMNVNPPTGKETFFLVFSRDVVSEIPKIASENGRFVSQAAIQRMIMESKQKLNETSRPHISQQKGGGAEGYAIWVTNFNKEDNDQMIAKITLNHVDK